MEERELLRLSLSVEWIHGSADKFYGRMDRGHGRTSRRWRRLEEVVGKGTGAGKGALTLPSVRPGVRLPPTSSSTVPPRVCHHRHRPSLVRLSLRTPAIRPVTLVSHMSRFFAGFRSPPSVPRYIPEGELGRARGPRFVPFSSRFFRGGKMVGNYLRDDEDVEGILYFRSLEQ